MDLLAPVDHLAMLAHAFLAIAAAIERTGSSPSPELGPLTCGEIRRLFTILLPRPATDLAHHLRWSTWRRHHQARARTSHYQRQAAQQP